ncbi:MAG: outer membrane beta-barrel protein [Gemmatimonadota bacterium]|nr:outer membrane beta-barrel protein [Gemmatimonadota bacterium]MDE2985643.1 outer membrane beta-barrel protein [Gemmatimonadota bacterium]
MGRQTATLAIVSAFALPVAAAAQEGAYLEWAIGAVIAPGLRVTGTDNDVGTKCDLIINPTRAETNGECDTQPPATAWYNEVGGARGMLAGVTAGYATRRLRLEAEYLYRSAAYNARAPTVIGDAVTLDKAEQELEVADGGVGDVAAHHWFANVHYHIAPGSRLRPHIGIGAGWARMSLDYFSRWKRNDDPAAITTFVDPVLKAKIAGTTTIGEGRLSDSMPGYQVLAGADYLLRDGVSLAVKVRRADFGDFDSGGREWLQLRSHDSTVGPGHRVLYSVSTGDTSFWTASFGMKYRW